jgi:hypothetical protein
MNVITLQDLKDKKAHDLHELERVIQRGRLVGATFFACDFSSTLDDFDLLKKRAKAIDNVFILLFDYQDEPDEGGQVNQGYLSQVNTALPKTFKTPQAVMSNAHKLDLKKYLIDATHWTASHFNIYQKQVEIARGKTERQ